MAEEESVVFEIQVERKLLERILIDNENFKENYDKWLHLEDQYKAIKDELNTVKQNSGQLEKENRELIEENTHLQTTIKKIEREYLLLTQQNQSMELEEVESKILKMKLQKVELEKQNLSGEFVRERKILENLLHDNYELKKTENDLRQLEEKFTNVSDELKHVKRALMHQKFENLQLDEAKLQLEQNVEKLKEQLRIQEARATSLDLEEVESKILKLKLQTVENEKKYLMADFERERHIISRQNRPRIAKLEENLKLLRKWIEKEGRERRPKESDEVKLLKEKILALEKDKQNLIEGFEMERKIFRKILKTNGQFHVNLP